MRRRMDLALFRRIAPGERGAATVEWLALSAAIMAILASVYVALPAAGLADTISDLLQRAVDGSVYQVGPPHPSPVEVTAFAPAIHGAPTGAQRFIGRLLQPSRVDAAEADAERVKARRKAIEQKYDIEVRDSTTRKWTAEELEWLDEALGELPSIFWGKSSLEYIQRVDVVKDTDGKPFATAAGAYKGDEEGNQWIELSDSAFTDDWGRESKTDLIGWIAHEATHSIQYFDLETKDQIAASANPLMTDYATRFGWKPPEAPSAKQSWDQWTYEGNLVDLPDYSWWRHGLSVFKSLWERQPSLKLSKDIVYSMTNPKEDMAEAVRLYVTDPGKLSEGRRKWIEENLWKTE